MLKLLSVLSLSLFLLACGGDAAPLSPTPPSPPVVTATPALVSVAPAMNSRTKSVVMVITGMNLDTIKPTATWSFPGYAGCAGATSAGFLIAGSTTAYQLTVTPGPSAAVGDLCDIRLVQPGVDVTLSPAFTTGP